VKLSPEWQQMRIDVGANDLTNVIGGFCWVTRASGTVYLDDIQFE